MGSSSYDIDDILNEVRKRRQEQEIAVKGVAFTAETDEKTPELNENAVENKEENKIVEENLQPESNESENETESTEVAADNEPQEETVEEPVNENEEKGFNQDDFISNKDIKTKPATQKADGEVDLFSLSDSLEDPEVLVKSKKKNEEKKKKKKKKTATIIITVVIILIAALVAGGVFAYSYFNKLLDDTTDKETPSLASTEEWHGMDKLEENFNPIYEDSSANISTYKSMVKKWYKNGTPASSTHVLNILLIGEDTREDEISEEDTRADSAIIASVNIDTGKIILTSILRDAYCYWETTEGDESTGQYGKINGAMSTGGIDCYIRTVENMYKVDIDNYVVVNFSSFQSIVDTLGGVDIEMTQKEINEINNHPKRYNYVSIEGEAGMHHLRGDEAVAYCRIRKIDSDNARADRQKTVLMQLFNKMKTASTVKIVEVATEILPYVKTGISKNEIISIAKYALKHGWTQYAVETYTIPNDAETDAEGNTIKGCVGGTYYGAWVWKVDYPLYSQMTQNRIYGKTNVVLAEKRPKFDKLS